VISETIHAYNEKHRLHAFERAMVQLTMLVCVMAGASVTTKRTEIAERLIRDIMAICERTMLVVAIVGRSCCRKERATFISATLGM
jgi:hypothetical protein